MSDGLLPMALAMELPEGFAWCDDCQASQPPGHTHESSLFGLPPPVLSIASLWGEIAVASRRAEFAESLLCALAFDHQRALDADEVWPGRNDGHACALCRSTDFCNYEHRKGEATP